MPATPIPSTPARPIIDIQAWSDQVEQTTQGLSATSLSPSPSSARTARRQVSIAIPLGEPGSLPSAPIPVLDTGTASDDPRATTPLRGHEAAHRSSPHVNQGQTPSTPRSHHTVNRRSEPIRRDSLKRREALLKGKEGSRARRRWENDRLVHNPHAAPPLPCDWAAGPPMPVRKEVFPYYLAPLWEAEYKARYLDVGAGAGRGSGSDDAGPDAREAAGVPRLIKQRIKRSRGAKGLLQDLERQVREFIAEWDGHGSGVDRDDGDGDVDGDNDDEDEIVFVGRDGSMRDLKVHRRESTSSSREQARRERLVFQSLASDHGATFGRWLVHSIATYYGLDTWSVTTGDPARREAYVAVKAPEKLPSPVDMPRPLWCMV